MKADAYREHLREQNVNETEKQEQLRVIQAFEDWLTKRGTDIETAGKKEASAYAGHLIAEGTNTMKTYDILCEYVLWCNLRALYIALVEVTDCYGSMEKLSETIKKWYGADIHDRIFAEPIPPLGADEVQRLTYTKTINARMKTLLTPDEVHAAWFQVQHGIPQEFWQEHDEKQREKYGVCESLDEFLERIREDRNAMLRRLHDEYKLWFTQEISEEALDYLVSNRHMKLGEHNGRKGIVVTKVPYNTDRVVRETDERLKRYYACHCPLIREAILNGETLSDDVCYCSLGHASHFLAGMGLENLEGEVIESAVKGDTRCRFIFYLSKEG